MNGSLIALLVVVSLLLTVSLIADDCLSRRRPLLMSALWNGSLIALLLALPTAMFMPRWEIPLLPPVESHGEMAATNEPVVTDDLVEAQPIYVPPTFDVQPLPATIAVPTVSRPSPIDWTRIIRRGLTVAYVLGAAVSLVRLAANLVAVTKLRDAARHLEQATWRSRLEVWRAKTGICARPDLLFSEQVSVPITLGWRRPAIVIPQDLINRARAEAIDAILVHELAHVRRADCAWQFVEHLVHVFYWFHPLAWPIGRRIAAVRERACDDFAIYLLADRRAYAETLLAMATRMASRHRLTLAMAVVRTTKLERRLTAIESSRGAALVRLGGCTRAALTLGLSAVVAAGLVARLVHAEAEPAPPRGEAIASAESDSAPPMQPEEKQQRERDTPLAGEKESASAKDYTFTDNVVNKLSQRKRDAARRLFVDLLRQQYDQAVELFSPQLRETLTGERLARLFDKLAKQFGKLQPRAVLYLGRLGDKELPDLMLIWGQKHFLSVRLLFDDQDKIAGLWIGSNSLAAQPDQPPIKVGEDEREFTTASMIAFGEPMMALVAKANLSLIVEWFDASGKQLTFGEPPGVFVSFFRAMHDGEPAQASDWNDTVDHIRWRHIANESPLENRAEHLAPGTYRAFWSRVRDAGYQLSDPITLDGSVQATVVKTTEQPGAKVIVKLVDDQTGKPIQGADVRVTSDDPRIPSYRYGSSEFPEATITFDGMLSGRHRIDAHRPAKQPGENDYEQVETPVYVELERGKTSEVTIKLRGKPAADQGLNARLRWIATGKVIDLEGRPIAGAIVRAATGEGTLLGGGSTTTDADGRFRLHFGEGIWSDNPVNLQVAVLSASKPGYFETNLNRQGGLAMARSQPAEDDLRHWGGQKVVFLPGEPRELNFELARAATIRVELVDAAGEDLAEASVSLSDQAKEWNGVASGETSRGGDYTFENVPVGRASWIAATVDKKLSARSLPFTLPRAENYRMKLRFRQDEANDLNLLEVQSITSAAGEEIKDKVLGDDPLARPPVTDADQAEARDLLKKLLDANSPWWFARPPAEIASIRYDFCFASGDRRNYAFEQDQEKFDHWVAHGLSYSSATAMLCANRNAVAFRLVEIQPNVVRLAYTTTTRWGYSVGNGVQGTWRGFQSGGVRDGILSIDPRRWVPLEHKFGDMREVFSDYVKLPSGQWAPRSVQIIEGDRPKFDWKFDLYEPGVWLFSSSRDTRNPDAPPIARLENVMINGAPGKLIN